ncbi:hypothetical protein MPTK1_2g08420 [Marchantia polymorpha subsp. ruderalis]|uniref:D-isomer specific 2-hydroxyacid dehydrogenase NAD-binding domain-containing protein n=1 Tax=Marchantia polymorpha TaxID=3197 RepID=A0A2R6XGY6_MARPO|nr:hypothetical protein MARPO_0015s0127 [Marchantia polymorpha]BBN01563.1 hypothetical protein Mp_2g08420 [Marchantia polymorpha subsp. ruderalis]|eukprot:PTQ45329.1 hypothetical protein MARPO_0015s0127 [Marchantia polymorpha]
MAQELEEARRMADGGKAAQLRLLFCGVGVFPTAVSRTCAALKSYPHILVDCLPLDEIAEKIHEYDMCVCRMGNLDRKTLLKASRLKLITQFGMGLERVDVETATEMGIKVGRIPSDSTGNALSCAEHAIFLMLSLLRDQKGLTKSVQEGSLGIPEGRTLFGCKVLIVGYGNIGKELAPRLKAFGVRVLAVRPSWNQMYPIAAGSENVMKHSLVSNGTIPMDDFVDEKGGMEHLHEFLSRSDIVVLCCTQSPKTVGMVNEDFLASMKMGALLVNVARGGLMDYTAVSEALKSGHLGGLATDVTWVEPIDPKDPIVHLPNVVVTPHVAGVTEYSYLQMGQLVADAALQLYDGKEITGLEFVN